MTTNSVKANTILCGTLYFTVLIPFSSKFQEWLSFLSAPIADVVGYEDDRIFLRCPQPLNGEGRRAITATLGDVSFKAHIEVIKVERFDVEARLITPRDIIPILEAAFFKEHRKESRCDRVIRVCCDEEGLQAMTLDISPTGLRLAAEAPIEVGRRLRLKLELDPDGLFPVRIDGICRWCCGGEDEPYQIGLDLSCAKEHHLRSLENFLATEPR